MQQVSFEEGKALAEEFRLTFFETSARTGEHVSDAFNEITLEIVENLRKDPNYYALDIGQLETAKIAETVAPRPEKKKWWC